MSEIMKHRVLTNEQIARVNESLKAANPLLHVQALLEKYELKWKMECNLSDPDFPEIIPRLVDQKTGKELDTGLGITLKFPPCEVEYLCVSAESALRGLRAKGDPIQNARFTVKPVQLEKADTSMRERYKDYFDAVEQVSRFFRDDLAMFLVENLNKHKYFSAKQTSTLQKLAQQDKTKAAEKVVDWITDDQNKSIWEFKPSLGKKKMFTDLKNDQHIDNADEFDKSGEFSTFLKNNPDKTFQTAPFNKPDGSKVELGEFSEIESDGAIFSNEITIIRLNKSKYAGAGMSIISMLKRCQLIVNGKPYGNGGSSIDTKPINVFEVLENTASSQPSVPVNITNVTDHKNATDVRELLKKRNHKHAHTDASKKRLKVKSEPIIHSDED